jgi:hypothetical protein
MVGLFCLDPAAAARAARMKRATLAGSFLPGAASTPELTSTPHGRAHADGLAHGLGREPGRQDHAVPRLAASRASVQEIGHPRLRPRSSARAVEQERRGLVRSSWARSAGLATLIVFSTGRGIAATTSGGSTPWSWTAPSPHSATTAPRAPAVVPEDAHRTHERREPGHDRRRGAGVT